MPLNDLLADLGEFDGDQPLIFSSDGKDAAPGYHLTEVKLASVSSLDCGGRRHQWSEARLQVLDGRGEQYMSVNKFRSIIARALEGLDGLRFADVHVEFAHGNLGLMLHSMGKPYEKGAGVVVPLEPISAQCKPAFDLALDSDATTSCCGSKQSTRACC
ncbi:MAG: DUF6428 family protein [Boseongicola sp.]|nr:DUF6428 family protein [Boseongicola sp.]